MSTADFPIGLYTIVSVVGQNGGMVSRTDHEDLSLNPKPVVKNPARYEPSKVRWELLKGLNGGYILSNAGFPTAVVNDALYADPAHLFTPEEWVITQTGPEHLQLYTIQTADRTRGWVATEDEVESPIAVRPLDDGPVYPRTQTFRINKE